MRTYIFRFYFANGDIATFESCNSNPAYTRAELLVSRMEHGQCYTIVKVMRSINDSKFRIVKNNRI
jgi:hypothetical protein